MFPLLFYFAITSVVFGREAFTPDQKPTINVSYSGPFLTHIACVNFLVKWRQKELLSSVKASTLFAACVPSRNPNLDELMKQKKIKETIA